MRVPDPCDDGWKVAVVEDAARTELDGLSRLQAARDLADAILEGRLQPSAPLLLQTAALFLKAASELESAGRRRAEALGEAA